MQDTEDEEDEEEVKMKKMKMKKMKKMKKMTPPKARWYVPATLAVFFQFLFGLAER